MYVLIKYTFIYACDIYEQNISVFSLINCIFINKNVYVPYIFVEYFRNY